MPLINSLLACSNDSRAAQTCTRGACVIVPGTLWIHKTDRIAQSLLGIMWGGTAHRSERHENWWSWLIPVMPYLTLSMLGLTKRLICHLSVDEWTSCPSPPLVQRKDYPPPYVGGSMERTHLVVSNQGPHQPPGRHRRAGQCYPQTQDAVPPSSDAS